jgi:hypothetical protein
MKLTVGQNYNASYSKMVDVRSINNDGTYIAIFMTKVKSFWQPDGQDYRATKQKIVDFLT